MSVRPGDVLQVHVFEDKALSMGLGWSGQMGSELIISWVFGHIQILFRDCCIQNIQIHGSCHYLWYRQISNSWLSLSRLSANSHCINMNTARKQHVRANAVPSEGNHAKRCQKFERQHYRACMDYSDYILFTVFTLTSWLPAQPSTRTYRDRVGASTRCFRTLHYSSALEVAQSTGREWGWSHFHTLQEFMQTVSMSRTVNLRFFVQSTATFVTEFKGHHIKAISCDILNGPSECIRWRQRTSAHSCRQICGLEPEFPEIESISWLSIVNITVLHEPIVPSVSQSDEAGPISQEAMKCASIRQCQLARTCPRGNQPDLSIS